jgi:hypothetical protein
MSSQPPESGTTLISSSAPESTMAAIIHKQTTCDGPDATNACASSSYPTKKDSEFPH